MALPTRSKVLGEATPPSKTSRNMEQLPVIQVNEFREKRTETRVVERAVKINNPAQIAFKLERADHLEMLIEIKKRGLTFSQYFTLLHKQEMARKKAEEGA